MSPGLLGFGLDANPDHSKVFTSELEDCLLKEISNVPFAYLLVVIIAMRQYSTPQILGQYRVFPTANFASLHPPYLYPTLASLTYGVSELSPYIFIAHAIHRDLMISRKLIIGVDNGDDGAILILLKRLFLHKTLYLDLARNTDSRLSTQSCSNGLSIPSTNSRTPSLSVSDYTVSPPLNSNARALSTFNPIIWADDSNAHSRGVHSAPWLLSTYASAFLISLLGTSPRRSPDKDHDILNTHPGRVVLFLLCTTPVSGFDETNTRDGLREGDFGTGCSTWYLEGLYVSGSSSFLVGILRVYHSHDVRDERQRRSDTMFVLEDLSLWGGEWVNSWSSRAGLRNERSSTLNEERSAKPCLPNSTLVLLGPSPSAPMTMTSKQSPRPQQAL
ncbi:hypothetical protein D9757_013550 [Collybiopsis confluens]|uniref:Uncharacterized protein n=1 Tax=Collybiopsis confluens TaxID=2823264 RepID=A0A8H5GAS7_9AGAR|nr:hypothetical protein D9757_013550 [Collybiopsis confluens]